MRRIFMVIFVSIIPISIISSCLFFVILILALFLNVDGKYIYKILADPAWQSIGAIISGIGVFFGAWLGAKLGKKSSEKTNKKQAEENAKVAFKNYTYEMNFNVGAFYKMKEYLNKINEYNLDFFDPIEIATKHVQRTAWVDFQRCGANYVVPLDIVLASINFEVSLNIALLNIQMYIAEWKQSYRNSDLGSLQKDFIDFQMSISGMVHDVIFKYEDFEEREDAIRMGIYSD